MPQKTEHITLDARIEKLKSKKGIFNFEGVLIEKIIGGYMLFGSKYSTEIEVLDAIAKAEGYLENSITISNYNGNFTAQNPEKV